MKPLNEIWKDLEEYLKVDKALEQGFSNGKYTRILAQYAHHVTGIDTSDAFLQMAKHNLEDCSNIELLLMDAKNMTFADKSFDVLLNTSFHEFDLSTNPYRVDLDLKEEILKEMIRVTDTIVFVEPTENAVTNTLFTVFNPVENHADRIHQSNTLIRKFMQEHGYALVASGKTYNEDRFTSQEELENEMLDWWADIKVPQSEEEKQEMVQKIDSILEEAGMLQDLRVVEEIGYMVFRKE